MRRKDRERDAAFALEVLRDCEYATLATINADGTPYCIPISPVLVNGAVYFHCATEGHKLDNISRNDAVCISGVRYTKLVPEEHEVEYESAVAAGKCKIISDEAEKTMALQTICEKYAKGNDKGKDNEVISRLLHKTCVCRVDIEKITGKANM
ncbi:MAG: pyridoxamine 5'-phosphate oxidase family protein [Defluviitaleaceae bacterium]|nr:pyridoxamine 5'-phosphate oxidase family protein [Defluviitaleaceae bacterium]